MSPELAMASAMFSESLKPAALFLGSTVGGIVTGFVLDRYFGKSRSMVGNDGFGALSLICALAVSFALVGLLDPNFGYATAGKVFAACALVSFWYNVRQNRHAPLSLSTDKRSFVLGRPTPNKVWFNSSILPALTAGTVKLKLEIRPDEDMTVVVVYSAKDGSFENREIFSEAVKKDQRYAWEIDIPHVSGTATVYLVTGEGGSWAGSKDYEF